MKRKVHLVITLYIYHQCTIIIVVSRTHSFIVYTVVAFSSSIVYTISHSMNLKKKLFKKEALKNCVFSLCCKIFIDAICVSTRTFTQHYNNLTKSSEIFCTWHNWPRWKWDVNVSKVCVVWTSYIFFFEMSSSSPPS